MNKNQAESIVRRECESDGLIPPSRVFRAVRQIYGESRADRILAYMGNGVSLDSAILATE